MDEEVRARLVEMRAVTPPGAMHLMNEYEAACNGYFERGADFTELLYDAFLGHMFDQFMTDFRAAHKAQLPELDDTPPDCWWNATWIFKGETGARYPFHAMLTLDLSIFAAAYVFEGGGGAAGPASGSGTWKNDLLTAWALGIDQAKAREARELGEIKEYAFKRYEPWSPPLIYDDLGWRRQKWGNQCYVLMAMTFVDKNWAWVFEVFELQKTMPEFLRELANEDDG